MKGVEQIEHTWHNISSPKRGHTVWGLLCLLAIAAVFVWAKHSDWLQSPNEWMLTNSPDGFKNYMTSAWHVVHDRGYVHYEGMNYPFGEHVLFTDNQPIVSAMLKWWHRHVFDIGGEVVGIVNVFQVLSLIFGVGIIYLLFRKLHLPVWYAGVAALGIGFLSPQYNRFDVHFGLSHIWVLPMLLLLLCRYEERKSRRYQSLLIGILIWFSAQLHFYNLGVSAVFLGFYTLYQMWLDRSWRNFWTRASHFIVMVVLPFALLNIWIHWSDYCPDRPAQPYGFVDYIGRWEGVFLPYEYFPLHQWINEHITKIRGMDYEAKSYAGILALLFTLWLIFRRRLRLFDPEWNTAAYHRVHKNYLRGVSFAGYAILLFGLGFPFAITGLEWLADYLGPFRQFRGLGRFTWAFYYSVNLLMFYIIWNKSQRINISERWVEMLKKRSAFLARHLQNIARWSLALIPLLILSWEAYYFQGHTKPQPVPNLALKSKTRTTPEHWLNKLDFARYQALMPLPYYHIGSENIWLDMYYPLYQKVQYTALQTGVPDMGVNMSRSAVGRMVKSLQFSLWACEPPAILSELPDNRPIALMIEPEKWETVREQYRHLLAKATPVYEGKDLKIMALVPDSVRSWSEQRAVAIAGEMERYAKADAGNGWRSFPAPGWYAHLNFDSLTTARHIFQGTGAGEGILGDTSWIWRGHIPKGLYYLSVWIKVDEDMGMTQEIRFQEKNQSDHREVYFRKGELRSDLKTIVNGWAFFDVPFDVQEENSSMNIFLHKKNTNAPFWYDEVLIKESSFTLYQKKPGWIVKNNFWHKMPPR